MGVGLAAGGPYVITPPLLRHSSIHKQNPTEGDPLNPTPPYPDDYIMLFLVLFLPVSHSGYFLLQIVFSGPPVNQKQTNMSEILPSTRYVPGESVCK